MRKSSSVLLITSLILLGFGLSGDVGAYGVALLIAAVIACCAAISGDVLQSMTAGQIIGATPNKQQIAEMIGVIAAAPVLALVISALNQAYGIGSTNLPAPQAFLMSGIVKGVLGGEMVWPFVLTGMVLAFILIIIDIPVQDKNKKISSSFPRPFHLNLNKFNDAYVDSPVLLSDYSEVGELHLPNGHRHISEFTHTIIGIATAKEIVSLLETPVN